MIFQYGSEIQWILIKLEAILKTDYECERIRMVAIL